MIYAITILLLLASTSSSALDCRESAKKIAIEDISAPKSKNLSRPYTKTGKYKSTDFYETKEKILRRPFEVTIGETSDFIPNNSPPSVDIKGDTAEYQFEVSLNAKHTNLICYSVTIRQKNCTKVKSHPISCDE